MKEKFANEGFVGPVRVLTPPECRRFLQAVRDRNEPPPLDWGKGHAANSRTCYKIAVHPAIVDVVCALLGKDVMLWGASILERPSAAVHPWHSDIESSVASGETVSVWVGLENTDRDSSLLLIPSSHRFGETVQEVRHAHGVGRDEADTDTILAWARERNERSRLLQPDMTDGEALFFHGRIWHGSRNLGDKSRRALLLQYATPDAEIRIPDLNVVDWPFRQLSQPRPPCIMVRGSDEFGVNRIVPPPGATGGGTGPRLTSRIYPFQIPLPPPDKGTGWKPFHIFRGSTADMRLLSCHISVLKQGQCPHPPHRHREEELLLVFAGEVEIELPDLQQSDGGSRQRLERGDLVYYPAQFAHTLTTVSEQPANYLMFKWFSDSGENGQPMGFGRFSFSELLKQTETGKGFRYRDVFRAPTGCLQTLNCHLSTLTPGAGYDPHVDSYDVAIIVLEGEVDTLGERVGPDSVIFYPAGEPHGIRNPGDKVAKYLVFEFHGGRSSVVDAELYRRPTVLSKLADPRWWGRKLSRMLKRVVR